MPEPLTGPELVARPPPGRRCAARPRRRSARPSPAPRRPADGPRSARSASAPRVVGRQRSRPAVYTVAAPRRRSGSGSRGRRAARGRSRRAPRGPRTDPRPLRRPAPGRRPAPAGAPTTDGIARSGSRKNPSEASAAAANGSARRRRRRAAPVSAAAPGTTMNGHPSSATGIARDLPPAGLYSRGGLIQDIIVRSRLPTSSIW